MAEYKDKIEKLMFSHVSLTAVDDAMQATSVVSCLESL